MHMKLVNVYFFLMEVTSSNAFASSLYVYPCAQNLYKNVCGNCKLNYQLFNSSDICPFYISECFRYLIALGTVLCLADVSVRKQPVR